MLLSESATLEDADLSTEASNVLALENNMQSGSYADNSRRVHKWTRLEDF